MTVKRSCDCPITLVLHDFFLQSSHFNLLETDGDCCSAPKPENSKESVFIDLVDPFAYMDELISSQANKPTVLVSNPVEDKTSSMLETVRPTVEKSNTMNMDKKSRKPTIPKLPQQSKTFYADEIKLKTSTKPKPPKPIHLDKKRKSKKPRLSKPPKPSYSGTDDKKLKKPTLQKPLKSKSINSEKKTMKPLNLINCDVNKKNSKNPTLSEQLKSNAKSNNQMKLENHQSSLDINENNTENAEQFFESMKVEELKTYIRERGVPVSKYKKNDLIMLAKSLHEMGAMTDPDFEKDSIECCLNERLTLPAGKKVPDPFCMKNMSSDFSSLPNFGLMDIFNHLIMSKANYDKEKLSSWRSFEEYTLCQAGHVRLLQNQIIFDNDDRKFHVIVAHVIPTQKELTQEGDKAYKLWFILQPDGSVYSAFCRCKGGADQGCRHLGAALFELDEFLSSERCSVTSLPAYWNPKPEPETKPIPYLEMKLFHSEGLKSKRKITNYDDSWIDSFDPRPTKQRNDISPEDKMSFAKKLQDIDEHSGILDFLYPDDEPEDSKEEQDACSQQIEDFSHLTILSKASLFVKNNFLSNENIMQQSLEFVNQLSTTASERDVINDITTGQHTTQCWHEFRHLLVTGKKIKGLFTRQKTVEKNPNEDVSKTVQNFLTPSKPFENNKCPVAIKYGTEKEDEAKTCYCRIMKKQHIKFGFSESGLVVSPDHGWVGASPDGIRECYCCEDTLVEFKCPYTGRDMDPKSAFLLDTVGGAINKAGFPYIRKNHIHYFQVQTGMAVCGLKQCDFVVFTNMGIFLAKVEFDEEFWKSTISTVKLFYTKKIIPALLLQIQESNDLDLPNSM